MVGITQTTAIIVLLAMLAIAIIVPVMTSRRRMKVQREREDKAYQTGVRYFNYMNDTEFECKGRLLHLAICVVTANDDLAGNSEQSNHAEGVLDAFLEFFQGNPEEGQAVLDNLQQARQQVDEVKTKTKTDSDGIKQLLIKASHSSEDHECRPSLSYMIGRINKEQENDSN